MKKFNTTTSKKENVQAALIIGAVFFLTAVITAFAIYID